MKKKKVKKIGILTSGGDAPGMNAVIRAVVRTCAANNIQVIGIEAGYTGLLENKKRILKSSDVSDIIEKGGTFLKTSRCEQFKTDPSCIDKAAENCLKNKIEALIVIGGDGSYAGAYELAQRGVNVIGIPGTIDNDINSTEYTIGFDTAVNTAIDFIDKVRDTSASHERCSVVKVMGRHAGYIALECAIACGADACLIPEEGKYDIEKVCLPILKRHERGKKHHLIIIAEGALSDRGIDKFCKEFEEHTQIKTCSSDTGYAVRGGHPSNKDRLIATQMGFKAVNLLLEGIANQIIAVSNGNIVSYPIEIAMKMRKTIDSNQIKIFKTMAEIKD